VKATFSAWSGLSVTVALVGVIHWLAEFLTVAGGLRRTAPSSVTWKSTTARWAEQGLASGPRVRLATVTWNVAAAPGLTRTSCFRGETAMPAGAAEAARPTATAATAMLVFQDVGMTNAPHHRTVKTIEAV